MVPLASKVSQPCSKPSVRTAPLEGTVLHTRQVVPAESSKSRTGMRMGKARAVPSFVTRITQYPRRHAAVAVTTGVL